MKYARDPVERAVLYAILGKVSEIHDNDPESFVESRTEAAKWYLTGYKELLPFRLPEQEPDLPTVEDYVESESDDADVDPERTAARLRFESQTNQRKQVELIRQLIHQREVYITRLRNLFKTRYDPFDFDSKKNFFAVADPLIANHDVTSAIWNSIDAPPSPANRSKAPISQDETVGQRPFRDSEPQAQQVLTAPSAEDDQDKLRSNPSEPKAVEEPKKEEPDH